MIDNEYISRTGIIAEYDRQHQGPPGGARKIMETFPAADVRPVVKAKWEWNDNNGYYYCGKCEAVSPRENQNGEYIDCPNFCHNCGADMRVGS